MNQETALRADAIVALAERDSGGFGLADAGLLARLAKLVDWVNERGPYTPDQTRAMREQIRRLLATRLRVALDRQRFPAIAQERIERPIFVCGLPRSGTTLLHSLLAEDPEVHAPQSWHMFSPSPPPGAGPVCAERMAHAQRQVEQWMDFCPAQKPMHPYIDKGAHQLCEDEELFSLDLRNTYPYQFYRIPVMDSMLTLDGDMHEAMRWHREFLQHLQWNTGRTRWACKGPSHQGHLDAIFAAYPDAICVWPHRPVGEIYPSIAILSGAIYEAITGNPIDLAAFGPALATGLKTGLDEMLAQDLVDDPRVIHLPFRQLAADPIAAVRAVYARQGLEVSAAFEQRMTDWLADPENQVDRYGRYPYSYETVGLDREWVEDLFADYSKRFGLD